jgi:hypothetical protein
VYEFGKALLAHCLHEQFFFDDDPNNLMLGFVCSCSGEDQKWTATLKELKLYPTELQNVLLMLKEKAKDPEGEWHIAQQVDALLTSKERHRRFMRQQKFGAIILAIDQALKCKRISDSKRKRLQRRKARLRVKMYQ